MVCAQVVFTVAMTLTASSKRVGEPQHPAPAAFGDVPEFGARPTVGVEGVQRQVELQHPADAAHDLVLLRAAIRVYRDPPLLFTQSEPDDRSADFPDML